MVFNQYVISVGDLCLGNELFRRNFWQCSSIACHSVIAREKSSITVSVIIPLLCSHTVQDTHIVVKIVAHCFIRLIVTWRLITTELIK